MCGDLTSGLSCAELHVVSAKYDVTGQIPTPWIPKNWTGEAREARAIWSTPAYRFIKQATDEAYRRRNRDKLRKVSLPTHNGGSMTHLSSHPTPAPSPKKFSGMFDFSGVSGDVAYVVVKTTTGMTS